MKTFKIFAAATTPRVSSPKAGKATPPPTAKKIATKVPMSVYHQLTDLQKAGGYGSIYELLQAMIMFFLRIRSAALNGDDDLDTYRDIREDTFTDEIADMFSEYSNHEPTPQPGHVPVRRRKNQRL